MNILDVRSTAECNGELGHLEGCQIIPLDELRAHTAEVRADRPLVVVCQTGRRSALATAILAKAGVAVKAAEPEFRDIAVEVLSELEGDDPPWDI